MAAGTEHLDRFDDVELLEAWAAMMVGGLPREKARERGENQTGALLGRFGLPGKR
jgi:hypothetical protein